MTEFELENLVQRLSEEKVVKLSDKIYNIQNCCYSISTQAAKLSLVLQKDSELVSIFIDLKKFKK